MGRNEDGSRPPDNFGREEFGDVVADGLGERRGLAESAGFIGQVRFHDADDFSPGSTVMIGEPMRSDGE